MKTVVMTMQCLVWRLHSQNKRYNDVCQKYTHHLPCATTWAGSIIPWVAHTTVSLDMLFLSVQMQTKYSNIYSPKAVAHAREEHINKQTLLPYQETVSLWGYSQHWTRTTGAQEIKGSSKSMEPQHAVALIMDCSFLGLHLWQN